MRENSATASVTNVTLAVRLALVLVMSLAFAFDATAGSSAQAQAREPVTVTLVAYGAADAGEATGLPESASSAKTAPVKPPMPPSSSACSAPPNQPALAEAFGGHYPDYGGKVVTAEVTVDSGQEVSWSVVLDMWKTTDLFEATEFLVGTTPGGSEILRLDCREGRLEKKGTFWAKPGVVYYVTLRAGYGYREAAGDIRRFDVFGRAQATIVYNQ